jgi:energy-coupling factor transporter ATP-binding protein EcfA2
VLDNIAREAKAYGLRGAALERFRKDVLGFADLAAKFHDLDVQRLSTGMRLRLSLALVLMSGADILIIDDVLGVGDIAFQRQCSDALAAFKRRGGAVLIASSDTDLIDRLADRAMRGGELVDDTAIGLSTRSIGDRTYRWEINQSRSENNVVELQRLSASLVDAAGGEASRLEISVTLNPKLPGAQVRPAANVFSGRTLLFRSLYPRYESLCSAVAFAIQMPLDLLPAGTYQIGFNASSMHDNVVFPLKIPDAMDLHISESNSVANTIGSGVLTPRLEWDVGVVGTLA